MILIIKTVIPSWVTLQLTPVEISKKKISPGNMTLYMNNENTLQDMQRVFTTCYPYLKIDFSRPVEVLAKKTLQTQKIQAMDRIGWFAGLEHTASINIDGNRTVAQVSADIEKIVDLSVMIRRRSGNVWIETSLTASWTLEQQNREGEHISLLG
jgi:hypothetical protein